MWISCSLNMILNYMLLIVITIRLLNAEISHNRQRRYLVFTKATQYGVFATVSIPIHPETYVSVAWFFEANYYNVDNVTYYEPLLGDIEVLRRRGRDVQGIPGFKPNDFSRKKLYILIEGLLEKHGLPGRECLLRAVCENANAELHNGLLGDLLYLILTPSTSMSEEEVEDTYYEAEFYGMDNDCEEYIKYCETNPLDAISSYIDEFV